MIHLHTVGFLNDLTTAVFSRALLGATGSPRRRRGHGFSWRHLASPP
jgi:hypothetical protein